MSAHCPKHPHGFGQCPACQRACQEVAKQQLQAAEDARAAWAREHG